MKGRRVIHIITEGKTEQIFVKELLAPYMGGKNIYVFPQIIGSNKNKGGDIRFSRVKRNIERLLKSQSDTIISLMVDYYGIKSDWPGYAESKQVTDHIRKAGIMNQMTAKEVQRLYPDHNRNERFISYISMYEIEALLFSDPRCISKHLNIAQGSVDSIIHKFGEPEKINDTPSGAPSKRLLQLSSNFSKLNTGIDIALEIGIPKMRDACPLFNDWLNRLEAVAGDANGQG